MQVTLNFREVACLSPALLGGKSKFGFRKVTLGLALMALLVGCGKSGPNRPKTYPVSGIVLMDSSPVAGAYITFESTTEPKQTGYALTNELGEFKLTTFDSGDGAVEGNHRVKVTKMETVAVESDSASIPPGGATKPRPKPKSLVPEKYGDFTTSGLSAVVSPSESKKHEFILHK